MLLEHLILEQRLFEQIMKFDQIVIRTNVVIASIIRTNTATTSIIRTYVVTTSII